MPRSLPPQDDASIDSIPSLYDLHAQNRQGAPPSLLPVRMLVTLKEKQSMADKQLNETTATTKKATLANLHHPTPHTQSRRLQCTLSLVKSSSKQL
jgi:hypothetical protein